MHVFHIVRFMHSDCERAAKHCTGDRRGLSPRAKFTTVEKKLNSLHLRLETAIHEMYSS